MSQFWFVKIKRALWFDGLNDFVEIPHSSSLYLDGDFTVLIWVLLERTPPAWTGIMDKGRVTVNDFWLLGNKDANQLLWGIGFTDNTIKEQVFPLVSLNQWNFYTFGIEGTNMFMSLNGAAKTLSAFTKTRKLATQRLTLGTRNNLTLYEQIRISEIRIYNRSLSNQEIFYLFNNGKGRQNPPEEGLVLDIDLNRWRGIDKVKDLSPYKNHGLIDGAIRVRDDR